MKTLGTFVISLCAMALIWGLLEPLLPSGAMGRRGKMLMATAFCVVAFSPLASLPKSGELSFSLPEESAQVTENTAVRVRQQTARQFNGILLDMVNQALASYDLQAVKVVADMDISEDKRIDMGQITVYIAPRDAQKSITVKQVAEKRLGTAVAVAVTEDSP